MYTSEDTIVIIESFTSTSITITIKPRLPVQIVYVPEFPSVPIIGFNPYDRTRTPDGGVTYVYIDISDLAVQEYTQILINRGFALDRQNTRTGYSVYISGDITVIIDTISHRGQLWVIIKPTTLITEKSPDFPDVIILPNPANITRPADGSVVYLYYDISESTIQRYYPRLDWSRIRN
ncbi:hypothetical protein FACS1894188_09490 [Clostridia bacterium]|nr:hypothetical protein FACS1894188_09490 [Clostridia bacterium]